MDADESGAPPPRGPALADYLDRFPVPIAVAHEDLGLGLIATWNSHGVDNLISALEVLYDRDGRFLLVVKTIRSRDGLDPRGLPLETPAIQLENFLSRADVVAHPARYHFDPARPGRSGQPDPVARRERYQRIQQAADHATRTPAVVSCDGASVTGQRIDVLGLAVVELPWRDGHTVLCTGVPDVVDHLALRTVTPADVVHV